jgi:hypothetical protein
MKTTKNLLFVVVLAFLFVLGISSFGASTVFAADPNMVKPGEFVIEPPTLINLGFEWYVEGDVNHDAAVEVQYRKKGDAVWKEALPLLRLYLEPRDAGGVPFVAPNMFAGSILDLEEDTEYECKFLMSDPDGVRGKAFQEVTVRTRAEPMPFEGGNVYHVYPPDWTGPKETPNFPTICRAYYPGLACGGDAFNIYPPRVQPGDTILVHAGVHKMSRWYYPGKGPFDGTMYLYQKGTPEKPVVIKGAGDGEAIIDGDGGPALFDVRVADYHYFEGLTIRNTEKAFMAGQKYGHGSIGLTIKKCRFEDVGVGVWSDSSESKNFYFADNVFIGRNDPNYLVGYAGLPWSDDPFGTYEHALLPGYPPPIIAPNGSFYGFKVYGSGHVICHNYVSNCHDGITHSTHGAPYGYPDPAAGPSLVPRDRMPVSIDIYNNDITNVQDNCVEGDGAMHNVRILRNRCLNTGVEPWSGQPILGGPAYFIRNISYHSPNVAGTLKGGGPDGAVFYHNTFLRELKDSSQNVHFRNNLILGGEPGIPQIFTMSTRTNYSTSDYNGFRPNPGAPYSFVWTSPPFDILADYTNPLVVRNFTTLAAYSEATGQDEHSKLVDFNVFFNLAPADPSDPQRVYEAQELDFQLNPDGVAVDAGCRLPNINDDFTGGAPDLGALEVGRPMPIYGPRP